jgi:metal-responsive CopG/Arc/MetJ family transcriptional regulator
MAKVDLEESLATSLEAVAKKKGRKPSELLNQIVDNYLKSQSRTRTNALKEFEPKKRRPSSPR